MVKPSPAAPPPAGPRPAERRDPPLTRAELMQGRREIIIEHPGERYRLQHTRNGKLILIK